MLAFYNFLDCVLRWLESFSAHCGYCILGHPFHLSFHSPCCWRSLSTALLQNTFRSLTACHSMTSLPSFLPSHSTVRATRSRTDVSLPTCAGFEKQFRRQETGREKERERKKRDTETKTHTERQRDTEILRLEEEPAESVISPGCVGRKLGRPWWWNPCKALTGCLRLSANRTAQWGRQCHHKSHFLRLSKNIALSVCIPLACPLSAKRNFPLHKNYSDISKTWNATNQDFPLRQLGNCGSLLPRHFLFAKESESLFLFNI